MIMCLATLSCQLKGNEYMDISKCLVQQLDVMQLEQVKNQYITSFCSQDQMIVNWNGNQSSFPYLPPAPVKWKSGLNRSLLVSQDI